MNLYELNAEITSTIAALMETADEETGEVDAELVARLDALQMERGTKLENLGLWVKQLNAETAALKAEESELAKRRKAKENMAERLKNYISSALQADGCERFERTRVVFTFRKSEAVQITGNVPKKYIIRKVEEAPDKKAIKAALKAGQAVRGAELVVKQNLQIK